MRRALISIPMLLCAAACTTVANRPGFPSRSAMIAPVLTSADARDSFTFAQPEIARVTHVDLDLALDFAAKAVGGTATLDV
ncbi:MAG: aminopeptidase, partial [Zymomonas sp.]